MDSRRQLGQHWVFHMCNFHYWIDLYLHLLIYILHWCAGLPVEASPDLKLQRLQGTSVATAVGGLKLDLLHQPLVQDWKWHLVLQLLLWFLHSGGQQISWMCHWHLKLWIERQREIQKGFECGLIKHCSALMWSICLSLGTFSEVIDIMAISQLA